MASGTHIIEYIDIDGNKQKETIKGSASEANRRADELRKHDCKVLKMHMFTNWKDSSIDSAIKACDARFRAKYGGKGRKLATEGEIIEAKNLKEAEKIAASKAGSFGWSVKPIDSAIKAKDAAVDEFRKTISLCKQIQNQYSGKPIGRNIDSSAIFAYTDRIIKKMEHYIKNEDKGWYD